MRVRANLNAKGWTMISEGLEMLEVALLVLMFQVCGNCLKLSLVKLMRTLKVTFQLLLLVVMLLPFIQLNERLILLVKTSPKFALLLEMKSQVTFCLNIYQWFVCLYKLTKGFLTIFLYFLSYSS